MKAAIHTVFYHAGGKWFGGARADSGWYVSDGTWSVPVVLAVPGPSLTRTPARKLLTVGDLAMAHRRAVLDANSAKHDYHEAIQAYEGSEYDYDSRIRVGGPGWDELQTATATEFAAYRAALRIAYNIKRRLDNACRKST